MLDLLDVDLGGLQGVVTHNDRVDQVFDLLHELVIRHHCHDLLIV